MKQIQTTHKIISGKITFSVLLLFTIFYNVVNAQYSQGGQPYSFGDNLREIALELPKQEILPAFDLAPLIKEDSINDENKAPFRFGYNHTVNYSFSNSGTWTVLPNGDRLWQLSIKSAGALALNLAFEDFFMPEGAKLFIYSADKNQVTGAFTKLNNQEDKGFATDLILGDAVVLEYYEPAEVAHQGQLKVFRVTHSYRAIKDYIGKSFGKSGTCQQNINCTIGANWQKEKNAVVFLIINGSKVCSGTLINDVAQDSKPYVLTANHCGSTGYNTWVFRFNWEAPGCSNPSTSPSSLSLSGCVKRASSAASDFSLVEISGGLVGMTIPASYNPYFAGWSRDNIPATSATCIHHPTGDIKKISQALNATQSNFFSGADCWRVGKWTTGCTEGGSSGSGLFDQNHRLIGQLFGGPSDCAANTIDMYDNFGKFATSWLGEGTDDTQLKHWLDPDNTDTLMINGTDSLTLGIPTYDAQTISALNIYPNPSSGNFNFQITLTKPQLVTAKVYDMLGQTICIKSFPNILNEVYTIDLNSENNGIYFMEISTPNYKLVKKISLLK